MHVAKILTTSITGIALAFSMLASTIPANAAVGYHAAYFSESDFLARSPGQTGQFAVGYTNTGDRAWVKGAAGQQANLGTAAPLDNTTDFTAGWSNGWLSANRYTAQDAALVAPGQIGFFIYNFTVPAGAALGEHRFYGREVIDGVTFMEDYGYYQSVTVVAAPVAAPGPVTQLKCAASPTSIPANGTSTSSVTASLADANGTTNPNAFGTVTFAQNTAANGTSSPTSASTTNGVASTTFTSNNTTPVGGDTVITATSGSFTCSVTVTTTPVAGTATQLTSTAVPNPIAANGTQQSTITVSVKDAAGTLVASDSGRTVTFFNNTPTICTLNSSTGTTAGGKATTTVTSTTTPGTCSIDYASAGLTGGNQTVGTVVTGPASKVTQTSTTSPQLVGAPITIKACIQDGAGTTVTSSNGTPITLTTTTAGSSATPATQTVNTTNGCSTFTLNDNTAQTVAYDITSAGLTKATGSATFTAPAAPAAPTFTAVGGTVVANTLNGTNTSGQIAGTVAQIGDSIQLYVNGVQVACTSANCTGLVGATINPDGTLKATALNFSVNVAPSSFGADGAKVVTFTDSGSAQSAGTPSITKDTVAPAIVAGTGTVTVTGGTNITATYTEAINCTTAAPGQFVYTETGSVTPVTATGLSCSGSVATLVFPAATTHAGLGGSLTYTQSATAANRVKDTAKNDAVSPQTVAVASGF